VHRALGRGAHSGDCDAVLETQGVMRTRDAAAALHRCAVVDRREAAPGIVVLGVRAPALAAAASPGQFVMIVPPHGERAATALGIYEASGERVSFMTFAVGPRTREIAEVRAGETLELLGPLGCGFDVAALGDDVAIVAGGVGIASVRLLAEALAARGVRQTLYYGARTATALVDVEAFEALGARVVLATDDGSRGRAGFVPPLLAEAIDHDAVAACGPTPMLRATARVAERRGWPAQLSLEEAFACGVGACWGCVVPIDRGSASAPAFPEVAAGEPRAYVHARICMEGPVFLASDLRW